MRIGYACINRSIPNGGIRTVRLAHYSEERVRDTVADNLGTLSRILEYNRAHGLLFFRISSQLIPFASHPVCSFPWADEFKQELASVGGFLRAHGMRASMHPDQFILINSPSEELFERSSGELSYHAAVLDAMRLDESHKIQIHVGGTYGDKPASIRRFIERYARLPEPVRLRLAVENDDRQFSVDDCLQIHAATGVPVIFDNLHHRYNGRDISVADCMTQTSKTWRASDGIPMVDYSSQEPGERVGTHAQSIDVRDFRRFLRESAGFDMDIMLEIKDKEASARKALNALKAPARARKERAERP